jgi:hypothetical protein
MSKNLTRKGLAFGAIVALGTTLFAGAPASAAGIDNGSVSLTPNTGTEYSVLAGQTFKLKANSASAVTAAGKNLKFLIADSASAVSVDTTNSTNASATSTKSELISATSAKLTFAAATNWKVGDRVAVASATTTGANTADGEVTAVSNVSPYSITYAVTGATITAESADTTAVATYIGAKRATSGNFVYDTHNASNAANRILALTATTTATVSADVTAWVDDNDDNLIDTTEYQSPVRTVKFLKSADITPTVSLDPVSAGATSLTARITTSPVLNGDQVGNKLGAVFTRQDSALSVAVLASSSWSDTTKVWTISKSLATTDTAGTLYGAATNGAWTDLVRAIAGTGASTTITDYVATTTMTAHKLRVGDKVGFDTDAHTVTLGAGTTTADLVTVTSVPSVNTFTWTSTVKTLAATSINYTVKTYTSNNSIVDRAFSGTYTAQAAVILAADIAQTTAQYLTKIGSATSNSASAKTAASVTVDALENANVGKTGANTTDVRKGTLEATTVVSVLDADSASVGAGVQVSATVTSAPVGAGTYKINGTTVTNGSVVYAATDASGQAKFVIANSSGLAADSIALSFTSEAVTAATETLTWATAVYSIVDLRDSRSVSDPSRLRSANKGSAVTFDLVVRDQFKQVADSALYRLKAAVTNRTILTQTYALTAGKATVTVADAQLGAGSVTNVALNIQKLVSGVWTDNAVDADIVDWDQANQIAAYEELGDVLITYYDQTDSIAVNANGATTPNTATTADLAATVTKGAFAALDLRVAAGNAPTYAGTAAAGVVSGIVKSSTTAVGRKGAVVTLTGAGLLFNSGDVWAIGSITTLSDASGFFSANVYSTSSGDKKIAIASNGATSTATVAFTGVATDKKVLSITGTQKISAGSTLRADILLVDGNGNAVDTTAPAATPAAAYIKVIYDGPGLLSGSAIANETDSEGKASVRYLLGTGDKGVATVTVKYDQNYDGDFVDATDIVVSRTYLIGVTAKVSGASATVKNALGATIKVVRGSKSATKVATSNSQKVTVKGGTGAVKVYVNGIKIK